MDPYFHWRNSTNSRAISDNTFDDTLKCPYAALRCVRVAATYEKVGLTGAMLARLASGAFYGVISRINICTTIVITPIARRDERRSNL